MPVVTGWKRPNNILTFGGYADPLAGAGSSSNWTLEVGAATQVQHCAPVLADDSQLSYCFWSAASDKAWHGYIVSTNTFNFDIPDTATIVGVEVDIEWKSVNGVNEDLTVTLINAGSGDATDHIGTNQATGEDFTGSFVKRRYGGPSNLWGATLTPSIVNGALFGVAFSSIRVSGQMNVQCASVRMRVYYTDGGTASNTPIPKIVSWTETSVPADLIGLAGTVPGKLPGGNCEEDVLLALVSSWNDDNSNTLPTGWTLISSDYDVSYAFSWMLAWKRASLEGSSLFQFGSSGVTRNSANSRIVRIRGADFLSPVDVHAKSVVSTSQIITFPSVTTNEDNTLILNFGVGMIVAPTLNSHWPIANPAGTIGYNPSWAATFANPYTAFHSSIKATAGAVGTKTVDSANSAGDKWYAITVAIKNDKSGPAPSPPATEKKLFALSGSRYNGDYTKRSYSPLWRKI